MMQDLTQPKSIAIELYFNQKQFQRLKKGFTPFTMNDKWYIEYIDDWIFFIRSWSGHGIYKAFVSKENNGCSIKEFFAERNPEKWKNEDDEYDKNLFVSLIARQLLGISPSQICNTRNLVAEKGVVHLWSVAGNVMFSTNGIDYTDEINSVLMGVAVGDALGVPVEFISRQEIMKRPVTDMIGYGTFNLPAGTWSDDSSLTFCLAEALTKDFDLNIIGDNFVKWYRFNYWTARGDVFDCGIATSRAIDRLMQGKVPDKSGGFDVLSNGNGSLMRIAPLVFYINNKPIDERYEYTKMVSSITHGHIRSVISCFYYLEFLKQLNFGLDKFEIYKNLQIQITDYLNSLSLPAEEIKIFDRLLNGNIYELPEEAIFSSGYVVHTLEASIWCLLTTDDFKSAVMKAVNLGYDSDTTGAVTGALAGLLYGVENIPSDWKKQIARHDDIENLAKRLGDKLCGRADTFPNNISL